MELQWSNLLSTKRERQSESAYATSKRLDSKYVARNEFEADYDRIVGSSSVRRLQDKAQVFPLQENDYTRTRLTHSIEVSAMARSLGKAVGRQLEERSIFDADQTERFAALLQTAGLIHDLGNPPFGHYGESVIRDWFKQYFEGISILKKTENVMSEQEKNDFLYFDGNVQNVRIVTKLQTLNDCYGANFTYATIASILKYPWASDKRPEKKDGSGKKGKFGYFKSEEDIIEEIQKETGLVENVRHPATYLLEAADDIIYSCDDIEDGVKKGYINWEEQYGCLKQSINRNADSAEKYKKLFERIENKVPDENMDPAEKKIAGVRNFRNIIQAHLFQCAVDRFAKSYDLIIKGEYEEEDLLYEEEPLMKELFRITKEDCFSCHEVLALELVGDRVLRTLLDIFVKTLTEHDGKELCDVKTYAGKVFKLISPNFVYIALNEERNKNLKGSKEEKLDQLSIYDKLHLAVDFISGMTDSYAVNLYEELTGIKLPR